jgi:uncharacterized DUF497 family protein
MRIDVLCCDEDTELHIWSRHRATFREAEEAALQNRLIMRGRSEGIYEIYGRAEAGRYLTVIVRYLGNCVAQLVTARDMSWAERRRYERHTAN